MVELFNSHIGISIIGMEYFVDEHSIVRKIWGKADSILFIFAGASAEFALNKSVDWLYFTGKLPADPLGRLFTTVSYAREIVFSEKENALMAIDKMSAIHSSVERKREASIPNWAYQDVLFMLIDYSIRSYELIEGKLNIVEKKEVFDVFYRVGIRMQIKELPNTFEEWEKMRKLHLQRNYGKSNFTDDLFNQYKKHLGNLRYFLLHEAQIMLAPKEIKKLLSSRNFSLLSPFVGIYKLSRKFKLDHLLKSAILPSKYKKEFRELDLYK